MAFMDENPYQAPCDGQRIQNTRKFSPIAWGFAFGCMAGVGLIIAAVVALMYAYSKLDLRENPRAWDEVHARQEAEKQRGQRATAD